MKTRYLIVAITAFLMISVSAHAQRLAVSTNIVDYAMFGTLNMELNFAVNRHYSIDASARVNPWVFNKGDKKEQLQNKLQSYSLGVRWWPWYVYSGFWAGAKGQYMEYDNGGIFSMTNEKGDAFGIGLSAGYMIIVNSSFNVNIGLGAWTGYSSFRSYEWTCCGPELKRGGKMFLWPNDLAVSVVYVF